MNDKWEPMFRDKIARRDWLNSATPAADAKWLSERVLELLDERAALIKDRDFHVAQCTALDASRLRLMAERDRFAAASRRQLDEISDIQQIRGRQERAIDALTAALDHIDENYSDPVGTVAHDAAFQAERILKG